MKTINVAEGSKIELTITALDIEEDGGSCPYDHLTVYDGETPNDAILAVGFIMRNCKNSNLITTQSKLNLRLGLT